MKTFSVMLFSHIIKREVSMHTVQVLTVSLMPEADVSTGINCVVSYQTVRPCYVFFGNS